MRESCLDCTIKHLGEAAIFDIEVQMGYPDFYVYVIGSLSHAAQEIYAENRDLAMIIREHRLNWENDCHTYNIPYEALTKYILSRRELQKWAAIPEECFAGLTKDSDTGNPLISGDTR
jgi:DNA/RNA endonuclease G (NUC1)